MMTDEDFIGGQEPCGPPTTRPPRQGSEDLHELQLQVAAHLHRTHARRRHPVAEVVVLQVPDHHLQARGSRA